MVEGEGDGDAERIRDWSASLGELPDEERGEPDGLAEGFQTAGMGIGCEAGGELERTLGEEEMQVEAAVGEVGGVSPRGAEVERASLEEEEEEEEEERREDERLTG